MEPMISELQIQPVKPTDGLVAFASFVLYNSVYCSSVAVFTRPSGEYRLVYPTKKVGSFELHIFHPITREAGKKIESLITAEMKRLGSEFQNG